MKFLSIRSFQYPGQTRARWTRSDQFEVWALELQSTVHKDFAIMEKARDTNINEGSQRFRNHGHGEG